MVEGEAFIQWDEEQEDKGVSDNTKQEDIIEHQ